MSVAPPRAESVSAYLRLFSPPTRAGLQKLRKAIAAAAPGAEECVSYGIPAFKIDGRLLVWFAAFKDHYSLFPGAEVVRTHAKELKAYSTSKGTIRFPKDEPLPAGLVAKLVKARIAEIRQERKGKAR